MSNSVNTHFQPLKMKTFSFGSSLCFMMFAIVEHIIKICELPLFFFFFAYILFDGEDSKLLGFMIQESRLANYKTKLNVRAVLSILALLVCLLSCTNK